MSGLLCLMQVDVLMEFVIFMFEYSIWLLQQRSFYISIFEDGIITSLRNNIMLHREVVSGRH